jgi:hypothetical protein
VEKNYEQGERKSEGKRRKDKGELKLKLKGPK